MFTDFVSAYETALVNCIFRHELRAAVVLDQLQAATRWLKLVRAVVALLGDVRVISFIFAHPIAFQPNVIPATL